MIEVIATKATFAQLDGKAKRKLQEIFDEVKTRNDDVKKAAEKILLPKDEFLNKIDSF